MNWALLVKLLLIASGRQSREGAGETSGSEAGSFLWEALEKAVQLPDTFTVSMLPSPEPPCPSLSQLLSLGQLGWTSLESGGLFPKRA